MMNVDLPHEFIFCSSGIRDPPLAINPAWDERNRRDNFYFRACDLRKGRDALIDKDPLNGIHGTWKQSRKRKNSHFARPASYHQ